VLEVTLTTQIRDPHRPPGHALTQRNEYKASDGYELELHPSGLAVTIRGRDHTRFAPIASAVVVEDDSADADEAAPDETAPATAPASQSSPAAALSLNSSASRT
jgi:hypothetical protein